MSEEVLLAVCPICGQAALASSDGHYACVACGTQVEQKRWLGIWPRNRFVFQKVGVGYRNVEAELIARSFTSLELAELAGTCYTDADLAAIAAGDLSRLHMPTSTIAHILFPQTSETCHIQVNNLTRAEGPPLPNGVERTSQAVDRSALNLLDQGNLFVSDQRLIFPSNTHTTIRIDRKLTGVRTFTEAIGVQRKGKGKATYFLGLQPRHVSLIAAYLQGRLGHLR